MIDVQSLTMRYGNFVALDNFSFQARDKEILGLLGPNGAGKTTAMRILTTYLYPTSGTAKVDGRDILENPVEVRKSIGYLPETAPLYADMRVDDYLRFVGEARGLQGMELVKRLKWVQESCDIGFIWKHTISELSKGYRQRVGLAQALIHDPKVLILDEPTSGLDPLQIIGIRSLIKNLAKEKTIIFSTHILSEVEAIADRIVIVNEGKMVAQGNLQELVQQVRASGEVKPNPSLEDVFISLLMPKKQKVKA
jgi:ABC-2 type transport system ATP-binding protein